MKRIGLSLLKTFSFWSTLGLSLLIVLMYLLSRPAIGLIPSPAILDIIEAKTLDLRFRLRGEVEPRETIVIVAVDEKTEDELGRWQSSGRRWLAEFLNILRAGNAKVIGFDLTLAEPDEGTGLHLIEEIQTHYRSQLSEEIRFCPTILTYLEQAKQIHDHDLQLAQAIQEAGNVVLGMYFFDAAGATHLTPEQHDAHRNTIEATAYGNIQFLQGSASYPLRLRHSSGVEPNLPAFSQSAKSFGHFNVVSDRDGYIRFSPLLIEYGDKYYPSLALEVARAYLDPPLPPIVHALGEEGAGHIDAIELGERLIPCDEEGKLLINYYGPARAFPYYSLSDVLLGAVPPYTFANKIVLLGITSRIIQDVHSTPFQATTYPGVEINATIIENILRVEFLTRPEWVTLVEALSIVLLGLILAIVRYRKSPLWAVWAALTCLTGIAGLAYGMFLFKKIWLNVTFPFLFILMDYFIITSYKYFTEERQKRGLKQAFQYYVAPTIVNDLLKSADTLKLGGEYAELTALFSDIRGFTNISEGVSPERLVEFLNEYFSEMTGIVLNYEGTVDKYIGDAVMAFYGAPIAQADHAVRACKTAVDMLLRLKELQVSWDARGLPPIDIGIGINSGGMIVGNMGARERFDYTIMGDNVNLASRLEGVNKQYGTHIIISEFTYQLIRGDSFLVRTLDTVRVKGKDAPVTIYELIGYGSYYAQKKPLVETFCQGLQAYRKREWEQAITFFREALQIEPSDRPSQIYIERCAEYTQHPPPEDWNGIFALCSK